MPVDSKHPLYSEFYEDWVTMRDCYRGERIIKSKGQLYLPATSGQEADGMAVDQPGWKSYKAYRTRAVFPEFVADAVEAMLGVMHQKPPSIELPSQLEPMREKATIHGESLEQLLRRINEQQLVTGRMGLLLDVPDAALANEAYPYIATYQAEHILNWDDGRRDELVGQQLNFVALDESEYERQSDFEWQWEDKFRVLVLGDPAQNEPRGMYRTGVFRNQNRSFSEEALVEPAMRGRTLDQLPFVFINSKDLLPQPDDPPLIGLAKLALAVYRGEADYRQSLFMQGQDTLVIVGGVDDEEHRIGAGGRISLPKEGQAYYIGTDSNGLPEMRSALENDRSEAALRAVQMIDNRSGQKESGEALRVRMSAQTATLNQMALAGAGGLEQVLRLAATWVGADPEKVVVEPNTDFATAELEGKTLVEFMTARSLGAPLSKRSIHRTMQKRDLTEMEYEDELAEIESEEPDTPGGTGVDDDGNVDDNDDDDGSGEDE